jgi:conjugative transposon TraM protein
MNMNMNSQANEEKTKITRKQKELLKKCAVFALMGIICAGCMWFIFAPSADDKAKQQSQAGFNTEIPMPKDETLIGDKRDAYEQEMMKQRQTERMRSLQDFASLLGNNTQEQPDDFVFIDEPAPVTTGSEYVPQNRSQSPIQTSTQAYRDINRSLGSFYERPREDPEKEQLREELEELKARMSVAETPANNAVDNQLELMEKSFQMAAKYMPGMTGTMGTTGTASVSSDETVSTENGVSGNIPVTPVEQVRQSTVSALLPEISDMDFLEMYSQPRNMGFFTATGEVKNEMKNTVSACIQADQTVMDGQNVRLRLLEPIQVQNRVIPRNTLLTGTARIQGERLTVTVVSIEHGGMVIPIELRVYDLDGQQGIFIPNMQELNAAKEIVANMGTNAGTSINLSNDAGKQFAADMGRNVIQGISQFTSKKLREVRVHLKAGYKVFLISESDLKAAGQSRLANR